MEVVFVIFNWKCFLLFLEMFFLFLLRIGLSRITITATLSVCNESIFTLFFSTGNVSQPIWLDKVQCSSSSTSCLAYCETCPSFEYANCHSQDVTVVCCEL